MQANTAYENETILSPVDVTEIPTKTGINEKKTNEYEMKVKRLTTEFMEEVVVLSLVHMQHCRRMSLK